MADGEEGKSPETGDLIAQIRDEMNAQFQEMKKAFESQVAELTAQNQKLQEDNKGLQAALVRSAVADPPAPAPKEKTPEELYQEQVDAIAQKTLENIKRSYTE